MVKDSTITANKIESFSSALVFQGGLVRKINFIESIMEE